MKASIRRIANGLLGIGVVAIALAVVSGVSAFCAAGESCIVASVVFSVPSGAIEYQASTLTSFSTPSGVESVVAPIPLRDMSGLLGLYLVTIAVLLLFILELFELYYIRQLLRIRFR